MKHIHMYIHIHIYSYTNLIQDFVFVSLPQVTVLDDIAVTKEKQTKAQNLYQQQVKSFNDSLRGINDMYRQEISNIDASYAARSVFFKV